MNSKPLIQEPAEDSTLIWDLDKTNNEKNLFFSFYLDFEAIKVSRASAYSAF